MRLLCGGKEIEPIDPGRSNMNDGRARRVRTQRIQGGTPIAGSDFASCGGMTLQIISRRGSEHTVSKILDAEDDPARVERF